MNDRSDRKASGRQKARHGYASAIAASLGAEVVFVGVTMGLSQLQGKDPWHITRAPASLLVGPAATHPAGFHASDVALGLAMHLVLGVLVGVAYAELLRRFPLPPVVAGLLAGGLLYTLGTYVLPELFPYWFSPMEKGPRERGMAAATHALYGLAFGLLYGAFRKHP